MKLKHNSAVAKYRNPLGAVPAGSKIKLRIDLLEKDMFKGALFKVTAAASIMTQVDFVYNIGILHGGSNINDFGMIIILVRNILAAVMLYLMIRGMHDILKKNENSAEGDS